MFVDTDTNKDGLVSRGSFSKLIDMAASIIAKAATLAAHPILDHGNKEEFKAFVKAALVVGSPEHTEMYWFLLELFTEADPDKDGIVMLTDFSAMLDKALESPKKLGMSHPEKGLLDADDVKRKA